MTPECIYKKSKICALTSRELPCFKIHGYVLVKTWLLIAFSMAFYAIILFGLTSSSKICQTFSIAKISRLKKETEYKKINELNSLYENIT